MTLTVGLVVALSVATAVVAASAALSLRDARRQATATLSNVGADMMVAREPDEEFLLSYNPVTKEGTHTIPLDRYVHSSSETPTSTTYSDASFGVPIADCNYIRAPQAKEIAALPGVERVAGALSAIYSTYWVIEPKVTVEEQWVSARVYTMDPKESSDLEHRAAADPLYKKYAAESNVIHAIGEEHMTRADFARLDELSLLMSDRKMSLYHKWRPDIWGKPPVRPKKIVEPPPPVSEIGQFAVYGMEPYIGLLMPADITKGRYLAADDSGKRIAIVREDFARAEKLTLGSDVVMTGLKYRVVGIARPSLGLAAPEVFVPLSTLQRDVNAPGVVNVLFVTAESPESLNEVRAAILKILPDARMTEAGDLERLMGPSLKGAARMASATGTAWAIALIAVAGLCVGLVSVASAQKRAREIATLRAIGWSTSAVAAPIALEGVVGAVLGGVIGALAGVGVVSRLGDPAPLKYSMEMSAEFTQALAGADIGGVFNGGLAIHASPAAVAVGALAAAVMCVALIALTIVRIAYVRPASVFANGRS